MSPRQLKMSRTALIGKCNWESRNRSFFKRRALGPWPPSPGVGTSLGREEKCSLPTNAGTKPQAGESRRRDSQSRRGLGLRRSVDEQAASSFKMQTGHEGVRRWAQHSSGTSHPLVRPPEHRATRREVPGGRVAVLENDLPVASGAPLGSEARRPPSWKCPGQR